MKADPDAVEAKIPWGRGPIGASVMSLIFVGFAIGAVILSDIPRREAVALAVLGIGWGLVLWRFDSWWGQRPSVRQVNSERFTEMPRYAPTLALEIGSALVAISLTSGWFVFAMTLLAVTQACIAPRWYKRRAARRKVRMDAIASGE
jgi:hypothetical protein